MKISLIQRQIAFNAKEINILHSIHNRNMERARFYKLVSDDAASMYYTAARNCSKKIGSLVALQKALKKDLAGSYLDELILELVSEYDEEMNYE